jgi:serine/threonine protein kinase
LLFIDNIQNNSTNMTNDEIVSGKARAWNLISKLGEGDAGEVYLVESVIERRRAILKRPKRNAFPSDTIRQASQIELEGQLLGALTSLNRMDRLIKIPELLDQSEPGNSLTERFFIVITQATGYSLGDLARIARFGNLNSDQYSIISDEEKRIEDRTFLDSLVDKRKLPDLLLLRALSGLLEFLESAHVLDITTNTIRHTGVLWNDVKPEHIYWDLQKSYFTLIDWGNGRFLEVDGSTKDGQHSRMDDYRQFLDEIGGFLHDFSSELHAKLAWPDRISPTNVYSDGILPLKDRLDKLIQTETIELGNARKLEIELLQSNQPDIDAWRQLDQVHDQIISYGELPNYEEASRFFYRLAHELLAQEKLDQFTDLCNQACSLPVLGETNLRLLERISRLIISQGFPLSPLVSGLNEDWASVLWGLRSLIPNQLEPQWWVEISADLRQRELGSEPIRPLVALNRLVHAMSVYVQEINAEQSSQAKISVSDQEIKTLLKYIKEEVQPRWIELEPDPPNSGLEYSDIESILDRILQIMPTAGEALANSLNQPRAQVKIVMDAWKRQELETTRRGLQRLLLWDPDRLRVLIADRSIQNSSDWIQAIRLGPGKDEPLQDFVTRLELEGREIRNHVGSAPWLDSILSAFKELRKGADPTQVLMENPEAYDYFTWLLELEPRRPLFGSLDRPILLERRPQENVRPPSLFGSKQGYLGPDADLFLTEPLDTWVPEARGSSARVFMGQIHESSGNSLPAAIKIMRPERIEYALPLFQEEVHILSLLHDVPGVASLLECGFIHLKDNGNIIPSEDRNESAQKLEGETVRFGLDSVHNFIADLEKRTSLGWLPYLALEKCQRSENLLFLCDTSYTRGRFLPTLEGLRMAIQICDILEAAHSRNIVYRDHKILHYYWSEEYNGIYLIDWNIAKRYPQGVSDSETQFDIVQFGARALHYIITGRSAPGALPLGPNRPDEIDAAARSYETRWTYDDQRLPQDIKDILTAVLAGEYKNVTGLRLDLNHVFMHLSELIHHGQEVDSE